jgi:hypothetical protein
MEMQRVQVPAVNDEASYQEQQQEERKRHEKLASQDWKTGRHEF